METRLGDLYNKNHKKLLTIAILLLIFSIIFLFYKQGTTGSFINRDVSLKGGITSTINTDKNVDIDSLRSELLKEFSGSDISIRRLADFNTGKNIGLIIEASDIKDEQIRPKIEELLDIKLTNKNYSVEETGASLGASFYKELIYAIIFAFIFMAIAVFITFRNLIPSLAVILSAFFDLIITLAIISFLDMKISTAGIAAFLMVLGYSIDTDILLTTRVLKRRVGTFFERLIGALKTGLTMTSTTVAALTVALIVTNSIILKQMFTIILVALIVDLISTWFMNASILKIYFKRKNLE